MSQSASQSTMEASTKDSQVEDVLKEAGLKITEPRLQVLALLSQVGLSHLSADQIYDRLRDKGVDIALGTLYRVLLQLEAHGLIEKHCFDGSQAVYEIKAEDHHDHLICDGCGRVEEFFSQVIEDSQEQIAKLHGFMLTHHQMILYGRCGHCMVQDNC